jgi:hypothetical protein
MTDPHRLDPPASPAFPVPRWARATAFVGVYALVLAGVVELQQSVQDLLAWAGMASDGLDRIGLLAGLYVAVMGLRPLLYLSMERNEGLYRMAWSLVAALSALAAATVATVVVHMTAPAFAESFPGSMAPAFAAIIVLGLSATVTLVATRRRKRKAGAIEADLETEEIEE